MMSQRFDFQRELGIIAGDISSIKTRVENPKLVLSDERFYNFMVGSNVGLTNYSAGDIIIRSDPVPFGFVGIIKDIDLAFTTNGGGIAFEIVKGGSSVIRFSTEFTATTNGAFSKFIGPGDSLQVVLLTTGAGIVDFDVSGLLQLSVSPSQIRALAGLPETERIEFESDIAGGGL